MPYEQTAWEWRNEEMTGEDFVPIKVWAWNAGAGKIRDHEDAAEAVAKTLTADDADYYGILARDGIELEVRSPNGEIKRMRAGGYADFTYTAEEVV